MERIFVGEILKCCHGSLLKGNKEDGFDSISTDSRSLKRNDLFIALKGKNFDGHNFIKEVDKLGAKGIIISKEIENIKELKSKIIIKVHNTLQSLKSISKYYLSKFKDLKIIGVTGSNGKTTTKDIIAHILSKENKVLKAKGSFNNSIGISLTILELDYSYNLLVLEYGTNLKGEIKELLEIARPDIGIITNIGRTHLEFFRNEKNVFKEKMDLVRGIKEKGTAIINVDDKYLRLALPSVKNKKILTYGIKNKADVRASRIFANRPKGAGFTHAPLEGTGFTLRILNSKKTINLHLLGMHNIYNALAAVSASFSLGMNINIIKKALEDFKISSPHRLEMFKMKKVLIIDDTYNANPDSVREAIKVLKNMHSQRKIIVLGDMAELGHKEANFHKEIGALIKDGDIDILITLGELSENVNKGAMMKGMNKKNMFHFDNKDEVVNLLRNFLKKDDVVLIKGSRMMKMEEIVLKLKNILRR
ncbi:MAG: UDP-N-acetylmuramoyl-tripeptide--D-alanyl-D-alanine ligase [Candidatus Firestonebacteria bacterium]